MSDDKKEQRPVVEVKPHGYQPTQRALRRVILQKTNNSGEANDW